VEQFTRELMPLITAGPPGTTGYAEGRPWIHPIFRYWPCLIERERVTAVVVSLESDVDQHNGVQTPLQFATSATANPMNAPVAAEPIALRPVMNFPTAPIPAGFKPETDQSSRATPQRLADIAYTRSGDKGINANIGVIARDPNGYDFLYHQITADRVAAYLGVDAVRVTRYEFPNLAALNFIVRGILSNLLRVDAQGKTLGQVLLNMPLNGKPTH
jgi:hypothetical protein